MNLACKPCSPWPRNSDLDMDSGSPAPGDFSLLFLSYKPVYWYLHNPAVDAERSGVERAEGCDDI